ncbi:hypothetical protein MAP00_008072 [Monascus purpureus]|nr:hypothetical protein MAP00_008072 [Monascus purpureus]
MSRVEHLPFGLEIVYESLAGKGYPFELNFQYGNLPNEATVIPELEAERERERESP